MPGIMTGSSWRTRLFELKVLDGPLAGAFRVRAGGGINWYFSHRAMWFVVDYDPGTVVRYLDLYLNEILLGSGYALDRGDDLLTTEFPDSHDAYAGAVLSLAARYATATGDLDWLRDRGPKLATIADANILSQAKLNGLIRVYQTPHMNGMGYLMDQCECYAGLRDFGRALEVANHRSASVYADAAVRLGGAINAILYDPQNKAWRWSDDGTTIQQRWYPDLAAQVFPHLYGVVTSERERDLTRYADGYSFLCSGAPEWWDRLYDPFPWLVIAYYVASRLGDTERARRMLATAASLPPDRFTVMDLAYADAVATAL
jgi:hypothetical protein